MLKSSISCQECINNNMKTEIISFEAYSVISLNLNKKNSKIKEGDLTINDLLENLEENEVLII